GRGPEEGGGGGGGGGGGSTVRRSALVRRGARATIGRPGARRWTRPGRSWRQRWTRRGGGPRPRLAPDFSVRRGRDAFFKFYMKTLFARQVREYEAKYGIRF